MDSNLAVVLTVAVVMLGSVGISWAHAWRDRAASTESLDKEEADRG